ncbi:MAG TPA: flagellar basal body rod protein FlgB [candidate division Zixibacteria bacterium]|nr:flagellar basal body rod protein FlgB [candidate division Zixibacteria bacterium]
MSLIDTKLTQTLAHYLDLTAARQAAIANNIANLDTPGYKTLDTNFGEQLRGLLNTENEKLPTRSVEVPGLIERPDGNNVSLDREGYLLGQTQLQFQAGAALLRSQVRNIQIAIREGNSQ